MYFKVLRTILFSSHFGTWISTITATFLRVIAKCMGCNSRHQLDVGKRVVFMLGDQDFPPALPCLNGGQCMYIFRIENGSLTELVDDFLEMTKGWRLHPGTVALATST